MWWILFSIFVVIFKVYEKWFGKTGLFSHNAWCLSCLIKVVKGGIIMNPWSVGFVDDGVKLGVIKLNQLKM